MFPLTPIFDALDGDKEIAQILDRPRWDLEGCKARVDAQMSDWSPDLPKLSALMRQRGKNGRFVKTVEPSSDFL